MDGKVLSQLRVQGESETADVRDRVLYLMGLEKNEEGKCIYAGKIVTFDDDGMPSTMDVEERIGLDSHLYNAAEKTYIDNTTSLFAVDLSNGPIQSTPAKSINLPAVRNGYTLMLICTASTITWSGSNIKWNGKSAPTLASGINVFTFVGHNGTWYATYGGVF